MPRIDISAAEEVVGSRYPSPYDEPCRARRNRRLGDAAGLTQFGVNLLELDPGAWSSQRHWHSHEDEFVWVLEGTVTLVTDAGEEAMRPGDCAGFKAGVPDGHKLENRTDSVAKVLVVGARDDRDYGEYSDIDMKTVPGRYTRTGSIFLRKDGTPLE